LGRTLLAEEQATEAELNSVDEGVQQEIADALESAKSAPYPDVEEVGAHVYA
jgi:TPP-dependent pyruvate/acetoin dehydrogenase alpha subunit